MMGQAGQEGFHGFRFFLSSFVAGIAHDAEKPVRGNEGGGLFQRRQGAFRSGDRFFVPARQIAQVENDGIHGASDQFRQAVMAGKMEPDGRGEQPFLLQTLPGGADGFFLHVKGVHLAGRANQPGQENRIVPVARRSVHDCVPGGDDAADPVMSAGHGAAEQGTFHDRVVQKLCLYDNLFMKFRCGKNDRLFFGRACVRKRHNTFCVFPHAGINHRRCHEDD